MVEVKFGAFTLNGRTRQLLRGTRPIHLPPKAFELITMLIERRPEAVSKTEIHQRLWPDTFVSDGNVAVLVRDIRGVLGDSVLKPLFVRTIHRFGYAFIAPTADVDTYAGVSHGGAGGWLVCGQDRAAIVPGENLVGRGPAATIRVGVDSAADLRADPVGVSRHHAMIVSAGDVVMLHDLSSKNGTFVDGVPVTAPAVLISGSQIRFGHLSVQYCQLGSVSATGTLDAADTLRKGPPTRRIVE